MKDLNGMVNVLLKKLMNKLKLIIINVLNYMLIWWL